MLPINRSTLLSLVSAPRRAIPGPSNALINLHTSTGNLASVFEPAEGQAPFSIVFDCTGETSFDRTEEVRRRVSPGR